MYNEEKNFENGSGSPPTRGKIKARENTFNECNMAWTPRPMKIELKKEKQKMKGIRDKLLKARQTQHVREQRRFQA